MARTRDSAKYAHLGRNKNALINGAFDVWQRGTSFASIAAGSYSADRWRYSINGAMVHDVSRSTDVPTVAQAGILAQYSLLMDCTTADASIAAGDLTAFQQRIEGYVWRNFAQRALTLSFWVKATKTGTYCISLINNPTGTADRGFVAEYTINVTDTWEKKTIQIPASPSAGTWDYTTGAGAQLGFAIAAGSNFQTTGGSWQTVAANVHATANQVNGVDSTSNNFRLALVQLEVGDVATDFEIEAFDQTLARCQRYYQKWFSYSTVPADGPADYGAAFVIGTPVTATGVICAGAEFRPEMRATPTITTYNPRTGGAAGRFTNAAADDTGAPGVFNATHKGVQLTSASSTLAGGLWYLGLTASAEL
jgi:hypothetical protein